MRGSEIRPVDRESWEDLADLFTAGPASCWCMWPRVPVGAMRTRDANTNRDEMREIVTSGAPPGLIARRDGRAVGWLALATRADFARLGPGPDGAWVIACVYLDPTARHTDLITRVISAAIDYASENGGTSLEAIPRGWRADSGDVGMSSLRSAFLSAGFEEVNPLAEGVGFRLQQGQR